MYYIYELTYGNGEFVALQNMLGKMVAFHSFDGINVIADTLASSPLHGITYADNKFISVGERGQTASSLDGINWSYGSIGNVQDFNAVAWGDGQYVAVGKSGAIATSSDGVLWTVRSASVSPNLYGVVGATDKIVAVGDSGTTLASPDGITWTSQGSAAAKRLQSVAWGNGAFCAVSDSGQVFTSSNAQNWVNIKTTNLPLYCTYIQNNGVIILGGGIEIDSCYAYISRCMPVCTQFCMSDHMVSFGALLTSQDKINWGAPLPNLTTIVRSICWGGNQYVGVGFYENIFRGSENSNTNYGVVLTSPDGTTWTNRNCGANSYLCGVAFGNKLFVAIGQFGTIMTSSDGVSWTSQIFKTSEYLQSVAYGNGVYVAVGTNGTIISSSNGVGWDLKNSGTTQSLTSVTFSHNLFIAVGNNGIIVTSPSTGTGISNAQYSKVAIQNSISFSDNIVRYALVSPSVVSLKLFDPRGCLVEKLVENRSSSGIHYVAIPRNISSGMFIVSLRAGDAKVDKVIMVGR
jgi:hypothetical protein